MHMSLLLTLPHATDALSGYSLIAIFSSTTLSAKSSLPRAIAPTKTAILCVSGNVGRYFDSFTVGASPESAAGSQSHQHAQAQRAKVQDVLSLIVFAGRWSVTGFLTYRCKIRPSSGVRSMLHTYLDNLKQLFWPVYTPDRQLVQELHCARGTTEPRKILREGQEHVPISPLNRLNVRGMRTCGLTSMSTPLAVWMYTCSSPALLSGESRSVRRHYSSRRSESPHYHPERCENAPDGLCLAAHLRCPCPSLPRCPGGRRS